MQVFFFLWIFFFFTGLSAESFDRIVAVIDKEIILQSDLDEFEMVYQNQPVFQQMEENERRKQILSKLVDEKVLLAIAEKDTTLMVTDEEVNARVSAQLERMQQENGGAVRFETLLRQTNGMTVAEFKVQMNNQVKEQALKQKLQEKYLGTSEPTRLQVKDFYTRYQDSLPVLKNSYKLSHLQMSIKADKEIIRKAYITCDSLIKLLDKEVSFSHLAKTYSDDPSGEDGGDLGFTKRGLLDPDYERAAFRLKPGEYTRKPVRTQFGFHVIKVTARRDIEIRSSHILIRIIPTRADTLKTIALLDSIRKAAVDSGNFSEIVAKYSEDKATRAKGGNLGWFTEKSMNEEYREVLKGLSEKEISESVLINGNYHLFRLDKQLAERRLSLDEDWKQISLLAQNFIMNKKLNGLLKNWRKKVYIEDRSGHNLSDEFPE